MSGKQLNRKQDHSQVPQQMPNNDPKTAIPNPSDNDLIREVVAMTVGQYSGPIPPPESLAGYERTLPGAADRILAMAERQSEHRQCLEKREVEIEARDSLLGIILAFVLGIGSLIVSFTIIVHVPESSGVIAAAIFGVSGFGSIITAFLKSTKRNNKQ